MKIKFFNLPYFIYLFLFLGILVGLYFLLRNKSEKTKKWVIFALILLNFALHFLKLLFPPYNESLERGLKDIFAINICAASVLVFPFIYLSKSKGAKDFMFYLGTLSGFLALVIPTEALGENALSLDIIRFYVAHGLILIGPFLMVALGVHKLDYHRIWKMPLYMMVYFMFIAVNQMVQSELGIVALRNGDFLNINYSNNSFFWKNENDALFALFNFLVPDIFKTVPYLESNIANGYAGEVKYWPIIFMFVPCLFYFTILPLLLCLPFEFKHIKNDFKYIFQKIFKKKRLN